MNDRVRSKVVQPQFGDDNFKARGVTFAVESTHEHKEGQTPLRFDIQRIDAVFNPEYEAIGSVYRHPVFFKSVPTGLTHGEQGFVDNGRRITNLDKSILQEG